MDLKTTLLNVPPRDTSGSTSSDRFTYQHTWAFCHLLNLHASGQDYVVMFDHHEDVAVLDSEDQPKSIYGYQVKTKDSGNYTVEALLKREAGKGQPPALLPSILGKLYDLRLRFADAVKLLEIVSNASVTVRLKSDGKKVYDREWTKFEELHDSQRQQIEMSLKDELGIQDPLVLDGVLAFLKSDIPLKGYETHAIGKLTEFLQALYPDREFRIIPLFRSLLSEVVVRNNNHEQPVDYTDLLKKKALSRSRFEGVLQQAGILPVRVDVETVLQRLNTEDCPLSLVRGIRREWDEVALDRLSRRDIPYLRLRELTSRSVKDHADEPKLLTLIDICITEIRPKLKTEWGFSEMYLKTSIAVEAYEH